MINTDPHANAPILTAGVPLDQAKLAIILIHGRGASAQDILSLSRELAHPNAVYLAPQAAGGQWYPYRFVEPIARNEPDFSSALGLLDRIVAQAGEAGIAADHVVIGGFSQGACMALEYAARRPQRWGGVIAFSGALIGDGDRLHAYTGSLAETPIFIGCSDIDFHIPLARVQESTKRLTMLGAAVTERLYPGMGHSINEDELEQARTLIAAVAM